MRNPNPMQFIKSLVLLAIVPLCFSNACADEPPMPTITVNGTAEIRVVPDEAVFTFSVESREKKLDDAVADNDKKIKAVIDFLKQSKVESNHIRTDMISIRPIFEQEDGPRWKGQMQTANLPQVQAPRDEDKEPNIQPIGYTARRQLSVTIKALDNFETIYRGLIKQGVNDVGGIQFRTTELRTHRDTARLKAIRAAKEKATALANELGATLAAVQTITENNYSPYSNYTQNVIASADSFGGENGGIAAGEIEVNATVQVVFKLGQTELEQSGEK